jgi:hypothetical protein
MSVPGRCRSALSANVFTVIVVILILWNMFTFLLWLALNVAFFSHGGPYMENFQSSLLVAAFIGGWIGWVSLAFAVAAASDDRLSNMHWTVWGGMLVGAGSLIVFNISPAYGFPQDINPVVAHVLFFLFIAGAAPTIVALWLGWVRFRSRIHF